MAYSVDWVMCAEVALLDQYGGGISLINVLDDITPQGYPFLLPRLRFVAMSTREDGDVATPPGRLRVTLDGVELFEGAVAIDFRDQLRHKALIGFSGFIIPNPGVLSFRISVGDGPAGGGQVIFRPAPPKAEQPGGEVRPQE